MSSSTTSTASAASGEVKFVAMDTGSIDKVLGLDLKNVTWDGKVRGTPLTDAEASATVKELEAVRAALEILDKVRPGYSIGLASGEGLAKVTSEQVMGPL